MTSDDEARRDRARRDPARDHAGKGPKGWHRSDERICEDVHVALMRDPALDAGDIEVRVQDCAVILTGTVADKYARRIAEDIAESVFGVTDVQNLLRVRRNDGGAEASSGRRGDVEVTRRPEREGVLDPTRERDAGHKEARGSRDGRAD
jgi:hypothetical protein